MTSEEVSEAILFAEQRLLVDLEMLIQIHGPGAALMRMTNIMTDYLRARPKPQLALVRS